MDKQELLRKYLDGELSSDQEKQALHTIADDDDLRATLQFDLFLRQSFHDTSSAAESFRVPEKFTAGVMAKIEQLEKHDAVQVQEHNLADKITSWLEAFITPRAFQLRPVFALSLLLIVILSPAIPFYFMQTGNQIAQTQNEVNAVQTVSEKQNQVWVRFIYVDDSAESISIAGDFNDWDPIALTKQEVEGQHVWTGFLTIPRGEHKYMFVVNGEKWVTDPLADMYQDDGFGNKNAIIYL